MLMFDCTKGFNLVSHSWIDKVLQKGMCPNGLRVGINRLVQYQSSILSFRGITKPPAIMHSGVRQGGPLSGILFVLICACFLASLALVPGVLQVLGFCDDWQTSFAGLRPIRRIAQLVREFEQASGAMIHKEKTKWLPNRNLTSPEQTTLRQIWPGAAITQREIVLGTPIGHTVQTKEFADRAIE